MSLDNLVSWVNPAVPFRKRLSPPPRTTSAFGVKGVAGSGRFEIELKTDNKDTAFHFNPRFNEQVVVRNTLLGGDWGGEERHGGFPFTAGSPFEVSIRVYDEYYQVEVNNVHYTVFNHRIPKEAVCILSITGDVQLRAVCYQPLHGFELPLSGYWCTIKDPPRPCVVQIARGYFARRRMIVKGIGNASRFSLNLQSGKHDGADIALHVDVRFCYGGDHNVVVLNSRIDGKWGDEERPASRFPFAPHQPFALFILTDHHRFRVAANNDGHYTDFKHRLPLTSVSHLTIQGDVKIDLIQFQ